ncbi:MAG: alpha/beta fold hydrolase [Ramlibacter sp.]|nr:alpha/beta fold hydrolase [Ramlibacter sp.]
MNARLILLPGLAADETMWEAQRTALAAWAPVVTDIHMQGHETIEAMAAALLASHEGEFVFCGASMGGMIAMEAARQAPARVAGLALLGTTARPETPEMRQVRETAIELFGQGRAMEVIEANVGFAFHPDNARDAVLVRAYLDFVERAGAGQLIRQNRAVISRPDARAHLPALRCPTLVMCGDRDQLTPLECSAEIAELVPGAELATVARCGHMLTMEQPGAVNAILTAWLERLPRRA